MTSEVELRGGDFDPERAMGLCDLGGWIGLFERWFARLHAANFVNR
jgi:hypothetical protein